MDNHAIPLQKLDFYLIRDINKPKCDPKQLLYPNNTDNSIHLLN